MANNLDPKKYLDNVRNETISAFSYLKIANECLSSPNKRPIGQELIIRALDALPLFKMHTNLLQTLIRSAGLYPYLPKYFPELSPEKRFAVDIFKSNFDENFIFHAMQARVFNLLLSGKNVVLSAPTSMGKSAIIDGLIAENKFNNIVIVVPTIALIDETRRRIKHRFGNAYQIIHHGLQKKRREKVIYIFTQERVNERDDLNDIDLFIIDEFYKLSDIKDELSRPRAFALNIALSKLLMISKQFYMIGPYIDSLQGMSILNREFTFIPSDFKTVAVNVHTYDIKPNDIHRKNIELKKICDTYKGQTIIYSKSSSSITKIIQFLSSLDIFKHPNFISQADSTTLEYYQWLEKHYGKDWTCTKALCLGIGIHHGALPRAIQQKTVDLFNDRKIRFLLCTSTMIEGVNTSAENIIIYDNRNGTPKIDSFTHKNISGRAGRMGQYLVGNVFCLEELLEHESQVVSLPIGQQNEDSPINLLASIQPEHLSDIGVNNIKQFTIHSDVPIEIVKQHPSYTVEVLEDALQLIRGLSNIEIEHISSAAYPKKQQLDFLSTFIKTVESGVLARLQLHYVDSDELYNRMNKYIYAESHSAYIAEQIKYIYNIHRDEEQRSLATDRELKIVRNVFKHAITRAISLLEDLLNHQLTSLNLTTRASLGRLIHTFENCHLPSSFSALEEMGIPIETLEKLVTPNLLKSEVEIDSLIRYLRMYYLHINRLSHVDKMFIKQAIS